MQNLDLARFSKIIIREVRGICRTLVFMFDFVLISRSPPQNSIALIRLDAIGDFVLWLDSAQYYREIYPDKRIVLIANQSWASLALNYSYWDEVLEVNVSKFSKFCLYRFKIIRKISKYGFCISIAPAYSKSTLVTDSICRSTNADIRVGSECDKNNMIRSFFENKIVDSWYSKLLKIDLMNSMELIYNISFLNALIDRPVYIPRIAKIPEFGKRINLVNYIVVSPGSSWSGKTWGCDNFAHVANIICKKYGFNLVLCGAESERQIASSMCKALEVDVLNLVGKTDLVDYIEIIRNSTLFLSNDTSGIHIASAVSTQSVSILGGGHYGRFLPYPKELEGVKPIVISHNMNCYGCNWNCIYPVAKSDPVKCIENISPEIVLATLDNYFNVLLNRQV